MSRVQGVNFGSVTEALWGCSQVCFWKQESKQLSISRRSQSRDDMMAKWRR